MAQQRSGLCPTRNNNEIVDARAHAEIRRVVQARQYVPYDDALCESRADGGDHEREQNEKGMDKLRAAVVLLVQAGRLIRVGRRYWCYWCLGDMMEEGRGRCR